MTRTLTAWADAVGAVASSCVETSVVAPLVPDLMTRYGLESYDALHAATAIHTGVRRIVTTDAGFAWMPETELAVYTDGSRVAACRRMRA
jgi:predicted nucleic acid-binding protein